jgi:serine/threonine-protein kinase
MSDADVLPFQPGHVIDAKYRIERVLGRGGMGVVYEAFHLPLAQSVALKVVLPEIGQNPEALARFMNEARNSARIESDHVARIMDTGCFQDGTPFMVMELLAGQDLDALLAAEVSLPAWRVADLMLEAIDGVSAAHALGIVHRDLKPANLFLTQKPGRPARVKVLDFGISKALGTSPMSGHHVTQTAAIVGSPAYMAPEQLRNSKEVDARADIWSLGVITYQLATGKLPFDADNVGALFADIIESEPAPMRTHRADVPPELERVVQRCMRKKADERFQTVVDLAAALAPLGTRTAEQALERISGGGVATAAYTSVPRLPTGSDPYSATQVSDPHQETVQGLPAQLRGAQGASKTAGSWVTHGTAPAPKKPMPLWLLGAGAALLLLTVAGLLGVRMYSARMPASAGGGASAAGAGAPVVPTSSLASATMVVPVPAGSIDAKGAATAATSGASAASSVLAPSAPSASSRGAPSGSASSGPRRPKAGSGNSPENPDDLFGRF